MGDAFFSEITILRYLILFTEDSEASALKSALTFVHGRQLPLYKANWLKVASGGEGHRTVSCVSFCDKCTASAFQMTVSLAQLYCNVEKALRQFRVIKKYAIDCTLYNVVRNRGKTEF